MSKLGANYPKCGICGEPFLRREIERGEVEYHYEGYGPRDPNRRQIVCHSECVANSEPESIVYTATYPLELQYDPR